MCNALNDSYKTKSDWIWDSFERMTGQEAVQLLRRGRSILGYRPDVPSQAKSAYREIVRTLQRLTMAIPSAAVWGKFPGYNYVAMIQADGQGPATRPRANAFIHAR